MTDKEHKHVVTFKMKCILCGHQETLDIPAGQKEGPACSKCLGPMVVESAQAKVPQRG